jgi:hypothetical protein
MPLHPNDSPGFLLWHATLRWQRGVARALKPLELTHVQFVLLACACNLTHEEWSRFITGRRLPKHVREWRSPTVVLVMYRARGIEFAARREGRDLRPFCVVERGVCTRSRAGSKRLEIVASHEVSRRLAAFDATRTSVCVVGPISASGLTTQ